MSQRNSGYDRRPNEEYFTPAWVLAQLAPYLRQWRIEAVWEPAPGDGRSAAALRGLGFVVIETHDDFLSRAQRPPTVKALVTNPPYGDDRQSLLACAFIRHALALDGLDVIAMLLRADFDSAKTRVDIFRDCPRFAGKIVLLNRIKWFPGPSGPSDNHCWALWTRAGAPTLPLIRYADL